MMHFTRRAILRNAATAAATALLPSSPLSASASRELSLFNAATRERLSLCYHDGNGYLTSALDRLQRFVAGPNANQAVFHDPSLYDLLWRLQVRLGTDGAAIEVRGGPFCANQVSEVEQAAERRLHRVGLAIDIALPAVPPWALSEVVEGLGAGGRGVYQRSGIVHLDLGRDRRWRRPLS